MELMESSFDLMQNPCSQFQRDFLDDAYSFVLTDAVIIKQTIKPTSVVQTAEPISTGSAKYNRCCETNKLNCSEKKK
jgi:hypothetical protein